MAGGSIGAIIGPRITAGLVSEHGIFGVMSLSLTCLCVATVLAVALGRYQRQRTQTRTQVIGGSIWEGAVSVFRSRYLLLACLLMLLHNLTSTFLYNGLAVLVDEQIVGFEQRTVFFGNVDFVVQCIAFVLQFFITARLVTSLGMPRTLVFVPMLLAGGFIILGAAFGLVLFAAMQVAQRSLNYGVIGPAKEMLFTVVDRETKYKSKNFIDTVIYRGSDVTASWIFKGLMSAGLPLAHVAWIFVPIMACWAWCAWRLGKTYTQLRASIDEKDSPNPASS